jgi:hypothetical protein
MTNVAPNHLKYLLATKAIDFANDQFKIILMKSGFSFNKDSHALYADVSASELATNYGYTQKDKVLASVSVTEDDTDDCCYVTWANPTWTASGGDIGPAAGACIIDETVANDPIVGYIDFGTDYTQADGGTASLSGVGVKIP